MNAGGRLDSSQNQFTDVEVTLVDIAIMIAPELLLISRMLSGGRQAVLLCRVDVCAIELLRLRSRRSSGCAEH